MEESQGVTEQAPETSTEPTESPTVEVDENQGSEGGEESGQIDKVLSPAQARIQKLANENRQFKTQLQQLQKNLEELGGARQLHEGLSKNPQYIRTVMDMIEGKWVDPLKAQSEKDPFEGYEPHEAEALRSAMEFKQYKMEQERREQERQQKFVQEHQQSLEDEFGEYLKKDGYLTDKGPVDVKALRTIEYSVRAALQEIAKDINVPTRAELKQAYEMVTEGLEPLKKIGLKKALEKPAVPPSGSKLGSVAPRGKTKETDAQRVERIMRETEGF